MSNFDDYRGVGVGLYPNTPVSGGGAAEVGQVRIPLGGVFDVVAQGPRDTDYDVPGWTVALPAGKHFVGYKAMVLIDNPIRIRITDASNNVYRSSVTFWSPGTSGGDASEAWNRILLDLAVPTTVKVRAACSTAATLAQLFEGNVTVGLPDPDTEAYFFYETIS